MFSCAGGQPCAAVPARSTRCIPADTRSTVCIAAALRAGHPAPGCQAGAGASMRPAPPPARKPARPHDGGGRRAPGRRARRRGSRRTPTTWRTWRWRPASGACWRSAATARSPSPTCARARCGAAAATAPGGPGEAGARACAAACRGALRPGCGNDDMAAASPGPAACTHVGARASRQPPL